jgi:nucleotide-binding universal stress UspA family protein
MLVATDGSSASDGALILTDLIAHRDEVPVSVLSVLDGPSSSVGDDRASEHFELVERRFASVRRQVGGIVGTSCDWRATIDIGPVADTICRIAEARAADLVVVGFGQHRRLRDRAPEKATVRGIAERSSIPVLVVPSPVRTLPNRAMLALDFSRASVQAGRAAVRIMDTPGEMHLVYVHTAREAIPAEPLDPDPTYGAGFAAFFDAVQRELAAPAGITFQRCVVQCGDPVSERLAYALTNGLELIAVGKHGTSTHDGLHLGSVSAGILRSAQCAVVVAGTGAPLTPDEGVAMPSTDISRGDR